MLCHYFLYLSMEHNKLTLKQICFSPLEIHLKSESTNTKVNVKCEKIPMLFFFSPKIHKTNEHNTHINLVKGILCRNKLLLTAKWKKGRSFIDCISRKHIHAIKTPTHGKVNKKSIFIYHLPWMAMSSAKIKQKLPSESDVGRQKERKWNRIHKQNVIYQIITAFK